MIPFNRPCWVGNEAELIAEAFAGKSIAGDGPFGKKQLGLSSIKELPSGYRR